MHIFITTFQESSPVIRQVRDAVFGDEQDIPRDLDWDGRDASCIHVLATGPENIPIGTGRLQPDGRIGRLAVLKPHRGRGIGSRMLACLIEAARARGIARVYLHAQTHSVPFYEKCGFRTEGEKFQEAGIPHVNMTRIVTDSGQD